MLHFALYAVDGIPLLYALSDVQTVPSGAVWVGTVAVSPARAEEILARFEVVLDGGHDPRLLWAAIPLGEIRGLQRGSTCH